MRRTLLVALVLMPLVQAQDARKERAAKLDAARRALQAQLEIADLLLERGDPDAATLAYRKAVETFAQALGAEAEPAKPVLKLTPEDPRLRVEELAKNPVPSFAEGRSAGKRNLRVGGGSGLTENAVALGLEWLARHQDEDGRWACADFMKHDPADDRCDGAGQPQFDVGVTGLALLAFLGAGHSDAGGPYADNIGRGLDFLASLQDEYGRIILDDRAALTIYEHAIATAALSEAYALTRSPRARDAATRAVTFLQKVRNQGLGWRYVRNGENDTSVTVWCTMALHSARLAGIAVDPEAFKGARAWVEKMTDPNFGQVGYIKPGGPSVRLEARAARFPEDKTHAMTAAGLLIRMISGEDPRKSEIIRKGSDWCLEIPPQWNPEDGSIDMVYWYLGTLAMHQMGGTPWRKWNEAMVETLVRHQHTKGSGSRTGSWDPIDPWGEDGGRVYSTALLTMCLEVYYRYERLFPLK